MEEEFQFFGFLLIPANYIIISITWQWHHGNKFLKLWNNHTMRKQDVISCDSLHVSVYYRCVITWYLVAYKETLYTIRIINTGVNLKCDDIWYHGKLIIHVNQIFGSLETWNYKNARCTKLLYYLGCFKQILENVI